ncbi:MerR family transcriptional regulator [Streptomyces lonarensis]|uniref:MerR family transcriptional regulator n=1 Tax=Streptomyces lonarensis TaxID=700599 RepID=A0A7X6CX92_9ACTN|nr:MerR family transcriptional regulator [Streptomyces lonarensis]NJQ04277.1 MerR family transcriptional regulator [Streptomyces lonarensis]
MASVMVDQHAAAHYAGVSASAIRRWAAEGLIGKEGVGRGQVRYDALDIEPAVRCELTDEVLERGRPVARELVAA